MSDTDALAQMDRANLAAAMRAEAAQIAAGHPDIDGPLAPPVIVRIPADLCDRDVEVLVRHEHGGVLVDVRADTHSSWTPICMVGGSLEVRPR